MQRAPIAIFVALLICALGCQGTSPASFWRPGVFGSSQPSEMQRAMNDQYDPYPATENAPQLVGSRPPDYQQPRAEVVRTQDDRWLRGMWNPFTWFGQ
ncbi:MAG: hypothetical protein HYS13_14215 [Planctomycetia bacterium]|nr:hypothetical protein [Planctomycetia bacterium]